MDPILAFYCICEKYLQTMSIYSMQWWWKWFIHVPPDLVRHKCVSCWDEL